MAARLDSSSSSWNWLASRREEDKEAQQVDGKLPPDEEETEQQPSPPATPQSGPANAAAQHVTTANTTTECKPDAVCRPTYGARSWAWTHRPRCPSQPSWWACFCICVHTISFTTNNVTLMSLVNPTGNDAKCSFSILQSCKRRVIIDRLSRKLFLQ